VALAVLLSLASLTGAAGLVVATFSTVIKITVGTTSTLSGHKTTFSGQDRHSFALVLIAAIAVPMTLGALRRAWPAMLALALCGVAALVIALAVDLPDLHKTGAIGRAYDQASAGAGLGYYAETLGGVLLLIAGGGLFALSGGLRRAPTEPEAAAAPAAKDAGWL
jgi:hypothetical protein